MSEEWFVFQTYALANHTAVQANDQAVEITSLQLQVDAFLSPVGAITLFAGQANSIPSGWLLCNGSQYSSTQYAELYAVIGIIYGGTVDNFIIPDLRNKFPIGGDSNVLGTTGGSNSITIAVDQLPIHNHTLTNSTAVVMSADSGHSHDVTAVPSRGFHCLDGGTQWMPNQEGSITTTTSVANITSTISGYTDNTGGNASIPITPPFIALNYIICYTKTPPS